MSPDDRPAEELRRLIARRRVDRREILRRSTALGLSAPVVASLLAACGGGDGRAAPFDALTSEQDENPLTPPPVVPDGEPAPGDSRPRGGSGKVRLRYWQAPAILNAHLAQGTKDYHAARVCGEPLYDWDIDTNPVLALAAEWPTVENGLLDPAGRFVVWRLREGVTWHDGEDFTAKDVRFTWQYARRPDIAATTASVYASVADVEIIDQHSVRVRFSASNPAWFEPFSGVTGIILPQHILGSELGPSARNAPFNLMPIGTGPWKVREFRPGESVAYDLFEGYWDPGRPAFDEVEIVGGGDPVSAARAVVVAGEADWAWNVQVEPETLVNLEAAGDQGRIVSEPGASSERIMINFSNPRQEINGAYSEPGAEHPIFSHPEARRALNLAIQRDVIAERLYGVAAVATGDALNVPARFKLNRPWEYDLEAARELLAAIDFPDGFEDRRIIYLTATNPVRQRNQELVKADLEQLGFQVELKSVDAGVFFSSDAANPDSYAHFYADLEMFTNGPASPYPITWARRFRSDEQAGQSNGWSGINITRYANPAYDRLHDRAQVVVSEAEQNAVWAEMLALVQDDVVEIPIVWRGGVAAVHNRIKNWRSSVFGATPVAFLKDWTL